MAIFEKTEYWGLKDPLEVRVQHGTCIYMGDTFSSHFEPKKLLSPQLGKQLISYQVLRLDQGTFSFDVGSMEKMAPLT